MICADRAFRFEITKAPSWRRPNSRSQDGDALRVRTTSSWRRRAVVGEYLYRAVVVAADKDGALQERASAEVRFVVKPHAAAAECLGCAVRDRGGRAFQVHGRRQMLGRVRPGRPGVEHLRPRRLASRHAQSSASDIWPGTDALYFAEVEAEAPLDGRRPSMGGQDGRRGIAELPHAAGSVRHGRSGRQPRPIAKSRSRPSTGRSKLRSRARAWSCIRTGR